MAKTIFGKYKIFPEMLKWWVLRFCCQADGTAYRRCRLPKPSKALQPSHGRFLSAAETILESPNIIWYYFEIPVCSLSYTNFVVDLISFMQPILYSIKGQILSHWKCTPSKNRPGHIFLEGCNFFIKTDINLLFAFRKKEWNIDQTNKKCLI